jgi:hypothetical protein
MLALVDHADFGGSRAALAEALGYKSGAYIRQLIDGERPITEKLIAKIEGLRGGKLRGWFADSPIEAAPVWPLRRWTQKEWGEIDPLDWAVAEDAAAQKLRELAQERAARPMGLSGKRVAHS